MITGGCLCGAVRYSYNAQLSEIVACHCSQCKRAQGSAFALNAPIDKQLFEWQKGETALREYRHSTHKKRVFCQNCGSPIYSQRDDLPDVLRLRVGTIDTDKLPEPSYHIYAETAETWFAFDSVKPRYETSKPD